MGEIAHFDSLRWEDQEKISARIAAGPGADFIEPKGKKGKKAGGAAKGGAGAGGALTDGTLLKDYRTEYAKSGAAKCRICEEKIAKVGLRKGQII